MGGYTHLMDANLDQYGLSKSRRQLMIAMVTWMAGCATYGWYLSNLTSFANARWLSVISMALAIPFFVIVYINLPQNRLASFAVINPRIEFPVWAQIFRAFCLACLAGYIFTPFMYTNLEWIPGIFLLLSLAAGAVGRFQTVFTGRNFLLVDFLFGLLDVCGLVIGSFNLVLADRASPVVLAVGIMALIFPAGDWLVLRVRKRPHNLAGNPSLRLLSGMLIGYLGAALLPIFSIEINSIAGVMLIAVTAVVYARQYLNGKDGEKAASRWGKISSSIPFHLILLLARIAAGFLVMLSPLFPTDFSNFPIFMLCFAAILGLIPRLCFLGIMGYTGLAMSTSETDPYFLLAFCLSEILVVLGGGGIALWSPEKNWLRAYAGDIEVKQEEQ